MDSAPSPGLLVTKRMSLRVAKAFQTCDARVSGDTYVTFKPAAKVGHWMSLVIELSAFSSAVFHIEGIVMTFLIEKCHMLSLHTAMHFARYGK